jgi:hypothetical protein
VRLLVADDDEWTFDGATPVPLLSSSGDPLLDVLTTAFLDG